jgi:hypothetical protein
MRSAQTIYPYKMKVMLQEEEEDAQHSLSHYVGIFGVLYALAYAKNNLCAH